MFRPEYAFSKRYFVEYPSLFYFFVVELILGLVENQLSMKKTHLKGPIAENIDELQFTMTEIGYTNVRISNWMAVRAGQLARLPEKSARYLLKNQQGRFSPKSTRKGFPKSTEKSVSCKISRKVPGKSATASAKSATSTQTQDDDE